MRLVILALLLSAVSIANGQSNPSLSQNTDPHSCDSSLKLISPDTCVISISPAISILPAAPSNLNQTGRAAPQVKPAIAAQLFTRGQNPVLFLALNQPAPPVAPKSSSRAKPLPIPTTFPNAHVERIPTNWPGLEFLLIDQPPSTTATTDPMKK
jgi:hypothetical protein